MITRWPTIAADSLLHGERLENWVPQKSWIGILNFI